MPLEVGFTGPDQVDAVTDLVNEVYAVAEKGLWADDARRTSGPEVTALVEAGELAVAMDGGRVVGCVRVRDVDPGTGEFGMLVAAFSHRGTGIGRRLVEFAEADRRQRGRTTMGLELLVPRVGTHPEKEKLKEWYGRLGYRLVASAPFAARHPQAAAFLAVPCDLEVYRKALA